MSLFGKILAILNAAAAAAFLYLATQDYYARQVASYAVFRYDVMLGGLPVDKDDRDESGRPRHQDISAGLLRELKVDGKDDLTLDEFFGQRQDELQNKIDADAGTDPKTKDQKLVAGYVAVLLSLAETAGEREELLGYLRTPPPKGYADLYPQLKQRFDDRFARARTIVGTKIRDRDGRRAAIAQVLVSLLGVLPTEEEKKRQADPKADPTEDPGFRKVLVVVGTRQMAHALDARARMLRDLAAQVDSGRQQERDHFAERHQAIVNTLINREYELQNQKDELGNKLAQVTTQANRATLQGQAVGDLTAQFKKAQDATAAELKRLTDQQQELYAVRVRVRDANRNNQEMEALVRKLEEKYSQR